MNGHDKGDHYRLYRFDERLIMTVLGQWRRFEMIALPEPINLPLGYELHGIEYSFAHRGFTMLVWHPSFDVVPEGARVPLSDETLRWNETVFNVELPALWSRQAEWSQATFGTDQERGPIGALKHLAREAGEAIAKPDDAEEYADCLLLVLDASRRAGLTLDHLVRAAVVKQQANMLRKWPTALSDEPVEHVKEPS